MLGIVEQGLILGLMSIGVFISFRIVNMADLTVDGTFALGGALCVRLFSLGLNAPVSLLLSLLAGAGAGILTGFLHRKLKINVLLAGILVMTMLYSINLRIMNGPNLPIPKTSVSASLGTFEQVAGKDPLADLFEPSAPVAAPQKEIAKHRTFENIFLGTADGQDLLLLSAIVLICVALTGLFLRTELGTALRGFGTNPSGLESFGLPKTLMTLLGLGLANAFVSLSGGIFALYSGFADVTMGQGMIVTGLAVVMLGEILFVRRKLVYGIFAPILGGIVYQGILAVVMRYGYRIGFRASDMKLLTALFIVAVIGFGLIQTKKRMKGKFRLSTIFGGGVGRD
ncbi:MAG TPA: Inner-membrane translocator [Thermotogota bacterium]|jgi:putative ABC transport system permease protein|nr:Inner-membrane translocator [Thermotogota bacterium]HNT95973.1 Inner-membrane translocator [Thermotogota bacterium]HOZ12572.1 Inner-membrane translocator [Thermotogota bacterium]HPB87102.1 Inner-membrane translocator [Thermotogota bacterium]HPH10778.1 Inner-membrane translocator [Thermotogota bacterium]